MAKSLPVEDVVCSECLSQVEAAPKLTFLGLKRFSCPSCLKDFTYPMSDGRRRGYIVATAVLALATAAGYVLAHVLPLAGILPLGILLGLNQDAKARKRMARETEAASEEPSTPATQELPVVGMDPAAPNPLTSLAMPPAPGAPGTRSPKPAPEPEPEERYVTVPLGAHTLPSPIGDPLGVHGGHTATSRHRFPSAPAPAHAAPPAPAPAASPPPKQHSPEPMRAPRVEPATVADHRVEHVEHVEQPDQPEETAREVIAPALGLKAESWTLSGGKRKSFRRR
jgi:hypothetical protein